MRKFFKIILYTLLSIALLLVGVFAVLNSSWGKNQIRNYAVNYLQKKLDTKVEIGKIDFKIPSSISLNKVLVLDKEKDSLLKVNDLDVKIDMFKLIEGKITINHIKLDGADFLMKRTATDTNYNFQFVIDSFAGKPDVAVAEKEQKTASSLYLDVGDILITNSSYKLNDTIGGIFFGIGMKKLLVQPQGIDLENMKFDVAAIEGNQLNAYLNMYPSALPEKPEDTVKTNLLLSLKQLTLNQSRFVMKDFGSNMSFNIEAKELAASMPAFNMLKQEIEIDNFTIDNCLSALAFEPIKGKVKAVEKNTSETAENGWRVSLKDLLIKETGFAYDDFNKPKIKEGIDYNHLDIRQFYTTASNVLYSTDTISGILKNLSMLEKSGLNVQAFRTAFTYHNKGAILDEFYLKTPQTLLQDKMAVSYKSLASLDKQMDKMKLDIALKQSVIDFKDVFIFLPEAQKKQLRQYRNQKVNLTLLASGPLEALNLNRLFLKGLTQTAIDVSGKVYGLPHANKLSYQLAIANLSSSKQDVKGFLPASVLQQINLPNSFAVNGTISGNTKFYRPDLYIKTSDGMAKVKGVVDMSHSGRESYDLMLLTSNLNIGKILKMEDKMGSLSMNGKVKGIGFDPKSMTATLDGSIQNFLFNGYKYSDLSLKGFLEKGKGNVVLNANDPNAFVSVQSYLDFSNKYPAITSNIKAEMVNLKALNLIDEDVVFTGDIEADIVSTNPDYPVANIVVKQPFVTFNGTTYILDDSYLHSNPNDSFQNISILLGNMMSAKLTGKVPLTKMGDVLLAHVNKYYTLNNQKYLKPLEYDMNLSGKINYHKLLRKLVPELRPFDTIDFYAMVTPLNLNAGLSATKLRYGNMVFDTLGFTAIEQDSTLSYALSLNRFAQGNIEFFNSSLYGFIKNDSISSYLNLTDKNAVDQFALGLLTTKDRMGNMQFQMTKGLKLNYDNWTVAPDNRIVYSNNQKGFFIDGLNLSHKKEQIKIQSNDTVFNSPFDILIKNFTLANLTKMISKDTLIADGILSADINLDLRDAYPKIVGNVQVDGLSVLENKQGSLFSNIQNPDKDKYDINANLIGNDNNIQAKGYYFTKPQLGNDMDIDVFIHSYTMKTIEGFSFGNLKNSNGSLLGKLKVNGTIQTPLVTGYIQTKDVQTTLSAFNTLMKMPNEKIDFISGMGLRFKNFEILDRLNRKAFLNGDLMTKNFTDYLLNLTFDANRWEAVNSTNKDNESIYGRMLLSANLRLKGELVAPMIDGNLNIHDSTDFYYAILENPELIANDGVVEFYDSKVLNDKEDYEEKMKKVKYLLSKSSALNVNIDIDKGAQFTVVIDPEKGDKLGVKGTAFLNANIGEDGGMALTGTYELDDGYYDLTLELIKKRFKIQKGSLLQLAGDPLDAEANITAIYDANAAPYDLMGAQISGSDDANYYRQPLPFQVLLKMSGKVMKPEISFDIVLQDKGTNTTNSSVTSTVETKLNELRNSPSDMNKQVVALLAFGRFVADNPFSTSGGLGLENAVRQSASRFLSEQLNRMAGGLIEGLELNFGVNSSEDYSTKEKINRTDLSVSASKRLFNDRLKITIGNDFALEGQSQVANQTQFLPSNISLDYLLSSDGKYSIRGYRQTDLQNIMNGYIVETGLSLRFGLEYNRFRQLWMGRDRYLDYMRKRWQERRKQEAEKDNLKKETIKELINNKKILDNIQKEKTAET
ncbi:MAG TPA: translocation/assembly module TamB domain-containing protein [Edaphocola sp.]|nr:translocation/assembly module TamB domain-containing protein [Edaphocola sp.]